MVTDSPLTLPMERVRQPIVEIVVSGRSLRTLALPIGNSMVSHNTSEMVRRVAEFREHSPAVANPIMDAIGAITMEAMHNMENHKELGNLMNRKDQYLTRSNFL